MFNTGVCEIATRLDGTGVFKVPTPLPSFLDIRGEGGSPTLTTSRVGVDFTDTGRTSRLQPPQL